MAVDRFFRRSELAEKLARQVLSTASGSATGSGLFLAAPRRTGKSTFVREDLRPVLQARGATVLYVDLWSDKKADPGSVIVGAVRAELAKHDGVIKRLAKSAGMDKITVGGVAFSLDRVGLGTGVSLADALSALSDEIKAPIVLIVDEAQHAITTEGGYDALFALKAARDEINSSAHFGLRIIATGSNSDKLAMLRNSKDQAFYGAPLVAFPQLGREFVDWFCAGAGLDAPLDPDVVEAAFEQAGRRPEVIGAAADCLRFAFDLDPKDASRRFSEAVAAQIKSANEQTLRALHSLTPLQLAVLTVLAARGVDYAPFEEATITAYSEVLASLAPNDSTKADISAAQSALQALQEKGLVWRERRGVYSLEEVATRDALQQDGLLALVPQAQDSGMRRNRWEAPAG